MSKEIGLFEARVTLRAPTDEEKVNSSGTSVIAVASGQHFVPGGFSRNKRYYPEGLWTKAFSNESVRIRMNGNSMWGTLGHKDEITEDFLRDGKVTHFTKNADPTTGYAESHILGTPAGKNLEIYLRSGGQLYVSSRADGSYKEGMTMTSPTGESVPVLDEDKYTLERFDWVVNPGYLEAHPKIKEDLGSERIQKITESYNELVPEQLNKDENIMAKRNEAEGVLDKTVTIGDVSGNQKDTSKTGDLSRGSFTKDNELSAPSAPDAPAGTDAKNKGSTENPDAGKKDTELDDKEQKTAGTDKDNVSASDAKDTTAKDKTIPAPKKENKDNDDDDKDGDKDSKEDDDDDKKGDKKDKEDDKSSESAAEELMIVIEELKGKVASYEAFFNEFGTQDQIRTAFENIENFTTEFGTPDVIREQLKKVTETKGVALDEKFVEEVGSPEEIKEALGRVKAFIQECGTNEEIRTVLESTDKFFSKYGTITQIESLIESAHEKKQENEALKISERTGVDSDKVLEHLKAGMTEHDITDMYRRMRNRASDRYIFQEEEKADKAKDGAADSIDTPQEGIEESRVGRIIGAFSSKASPASFTISE